MRALIVGVFASFAFQALAQAEEPLRFYIGTATKANSGGIFFSSLSLDTGAISEPQLAAATDRSTFIAFHPTEQVLYSCAELSTGEGLGGAGIIAWKIDASTGKLTEINRQPAGGEGACFVTVRRDGRYAAIANYGSGSISLYPLQKDGRIDPASANVQHEGTGPDPKRQMGPHAHSAQFDATGNRLLAADLGTDDIFIYDIQSDGSLSPSVPPSLLAPPASGPRHFAFSPDNRFVLGLGEMHGSITTFSYDPIKPQPVSTISTMAEGVAPDAVRASAEILFHPKLPVVYCSNRGPNEIAIFDFDSASGKLTRRSAINCGGETPRNFRLTPDGRFFLVANQASNSVAVFKVDSATGDLSATDNSIAVPSPMCIKFVDNASR